MRDREPRESFAERLIEQDAGITPTSLKEQTEMLQHTLEVLDANAQSSRRFTIMAIMAVAVCYLFGYAIMLVQPWMPREAQFLVVSWTLCTWAALITAAIAVTRYWTVHRPRLEKGRTDLQVAMFQDLQRQIAELRKGP